MSDPGKIILARPPRPTASIIIAVSEPVDRLLACLRSVSASMRSDMPYETIVVLNDPMVGEIDRLRAAVANVEIIVSNVNLGLAGSCNRGRAAARGDYLMLLHDDTEVEAGWLEALVDLAERKRHVGAVGSKILNVDGSLQAAGMIIWRDAVTSPAWPGDTVPPERELSEARAVDQCASCSLLIRTSAWDIAGGLDERFYPAYYVDVDLCMSLRQAGFGIVFEPGSRVLHHGSASTDPYLRTFVFGRNRLAFQAKWSDALAAHVARDDGDLAGSKRVALARTASEHAVLEAASDGRDASPAAVGSFDAREQADRHRAMERALLKGYVATLTEQLDASRRVRRQPAPLYRLGTDIVFNDEGNGADYLVEGGCHGAEDWGVWLEENCRLILPLEQGLYDDGAQPLLLTLSVRHVIVRDRTRSPFRLAINGVVLLDEVERQAASREYRVDIPASLHDDMRALVLRIDVRERRSPKDLGDASGDTRLLGMGLVTLNVTNANPI